MNPTKDLEALLQKQRTLHRFEEVREVVAEAYDRQFRDRVIDLEDLTVVEGGREFGLMLEVPQIGTLAVTEFAKSQLGTAVGVKWDKWFDPQYIKPDEVQEELTRRFARTREARMVRASAFPEDAENPEGLDGYIRGFLGPKYTPIDDEHVFAQMESHIGPFLTDMRFMEDHMGGTWQDDRTSHFSAVGPALRLGDLGGYTYEQALADNALPADDWACLGFHIRNSAVGYAALTIDQFLYRLVCYNGMVRSDPVGRALYRRHVKTDATTLGALLREAFAKILTGWDETTRGIRLLQETTLDDPQREIESFLRAQRSSQKIVDATLAAWKREPEATKIGVMHALSLAAQTAEDMNERYEREALAGLYLAQA